VVFPGCQSIILMHGHESQAAKEATDQQSEALRKKSKVVRLLIQEGCHPDMNLQPPPGNVSACE
jgi:hypothetical protein